MDQIGSEIGQKMRVSGRAGKSKQNFHFFGFFQSAIKAKLNEMGAGYIDEELPDYVMILLVNKKSRDAMEEALNLFLGESTTTFVAWFD